jgi:hypothetical protein
MVLLLLARAARTPTSGNVHGSIHILIFVVFEHRLAVIITRIFSL